MAGKEHLVSMHIAIILPRWVGDLVMSTPMIRAVRQHFGKGAKLTAVVKPLFQDILAGTNWFDEFIAYDRHSKKQESGFQQEEHLSQVRLQACLQACGCLLPIGH